jgi:arginyl-tRNA synthetase
MIKEQIQQLVQNAMTAAQIGGSLPAVDLPSVELARPKQAEHGDYSSNIALVLSAAIRKSGGNANPRAIAQAIVEAMPASDMISKVELAGPGFINITLANRWLQQQPAAIMVAGERFGDNQRGVGRYWQVEYVSANPTGPLHIGGARNAVLGDALANVLAASGYTVQREFYVNDAGAQFQLFLETLYARTCQLLGKEEPLPAEGYQGEYMIDYARQVLEGQGAPAHDWLQMDKADALAALRPLGREIVVTALQDELGRIGVHFDRWFSEQSLYDEGLVEQALDYLQVRGELERREGALWFTASRYPNNEKDEVVVRSNGRPTYFASDIAYHYDKFVRRGFERVINVLSVDHQGHAPRMSAIMQAFGLDPARLTILFYDLVKLVREGKEVKLSKRKGNLITINDVVDEVGSDAIHFLLLLRSPESVIEFDMELAIEQDDKNPVYYVQYGHARICSILGKARSAGLDTDATAVSAEQLQLLIHPSEFTLIRKLLELEEQVELAVDKLSPHNLTHYALDLTRTFSAFYRDCRVVDPETPALSQTRLLLCQATRLVLAKTLRLIGVKAPETM